MNLHPHCCENFISFKGEFLPVHAMKTYGVVEKVKFYAFLNYSTRWSQLHALAILTAVNEHVVPNRRSDGPQSQSEHFEEESPCSWPKLDDDSSVIQTIAQSL